MEKLIALIAGIGGASFLAWFLNRDKPIYEITNVTSTSTNTGVFKLMEQSERQNIINEARSELRASKISREGYRNDVYLDSLGFPTVGIGHLIVPSDNLKLGDIISDARVDELYAKDEEKAFNAAIKQADELDKFTKEFIIALSHVNFQLGTGWARKFPNTYAALKSGNYSTAINNLKNSKWNTDTPVRVADFIQAIYNAYV